MVDGLSKYISKLLLENEQVVIPGFGTFSIKNIPATIDEHLGLLKPPSSDIDFTIVEENQLNRFPYFLQNKYNVTFDEANQLISNYVTLLHQALDNKDIIVFDGLGKMYKDYQQSIQFIQDQSNFCKESFNFPVLNYFPVRKAMRIELPKEVVSAVSSSTKEGYTDTSNNKKIGVFARSKNKWQTISLYVASIIGFLLFSYLTIDYFIIEPSKSVSVTKVNVKPTSRLDKHTMGFKPKTKDSELLTELKEEMGDYKEENYSIKDANVAEKKAKIYDMKLLPSEETSVVKKKSIIKPKKLPKKTITKPAIKPKAVPKIKKAEKSGTAVFIVNAFQNAKNVDEMIQVLQEKGYRVYTDSTGKLTRVGVFSDYIGYQDLLYKLGTVRKQFNEKSWILKR